MKLSLNAKSPSKNQICFYSTKSKKVSFCSCSKPETKADIQQQFKNETLKASFGEMVFYRNSEGGHELYVGTGECNLTEEKLRQLTGKI